MQPAVQEPEETSQDTTVTEIVSKRHLIHFPAFRTMLRSRLHSADIAIDLGTCNTLVHRRGEGIVCNEPSLVALRNGSTPTRERVVAIGAAAKPMLGRTPQSVTVTRPLSSGAIVDFEIASAMIRYFTRKGGSRLTALHSRVLIAVPVEITSVERHAVLESAKAAGAREVFLVAQPIAAALGAGLPATDAVGSMVVDIGAGTTQVAAISMGGIVCSHTSRVAGDKMDEAIVRYMERTHRLQIGKSRAERMKIAVSTAGSTNDVDMEITGRDLSGGMPRSVHVSDLEIGEALADCIKDVVESVRLVLERTPPELVEDIAERGIVLTGGGTLVRGLEDALRNEVKLAVSIVNDPLTAVVNGAGKLLEEPALFNAVIVGSV